VDATPATVMRDIVLSTPGATAAFERFHVDYCCGGSLTLEEACARAHAPVEEVLSALAEEAARPGAQIAGGEMLSVPLENLVERLVTVHHVRSRESAAKLPALARDAAAKEGRARPELARIAELASELFGALLPHLDFEERHVFPYVVAMERAGREGRPPPVALFSTIAEPMRDMEHEHEAADRAMHEMQQLAGEYRVPDGASDTLRALYADLDAHEKELVRHMHLEGNVLLPRAERLEQKLRTSSRRR
jgi:regulator of cell morphogenesis and NO signaling